MTDDPHNSLTPGEIAIVCARYDIAGVASAEALGAGSGGSPKAVLRLKDGRRLLLKRRGPGHDDPELVRFTHEIQRRLAEHAYPLAPLHATREGETMLTIDGRIYELFDFVEGGAYARTRSATKDAGRGLAFFHRILAKHLPSHRTPMSTFHDGAHVRAAFDVRDEDVASARALYEDAAGRANALGLASWPTQIIHADWHPGNMLFRKGRVAAVLDYDAARVGARTLDVAYGCAQFSMTGSGTPGDWPEEADLARLGAFFSGYESVPGGVLSKAEIEALPWLMAEALIAEASIGLRAGRFEGGVLRAIGSKASWIVRHRDEVRGCVNK